MKLIQVASRGLGITMCVICFLALCWEQLISYLAQNKGLSQQLSRVKELKLPVLVFCLENPYINKPHGGLLEKEEFLSNMRNFSVTLKGRPGIGYNFFSN